MRKLCNSLNIKFQYTFNILEVSTTIIILNRYPQEGIQLKPLTSKMPKGLCALLLRKGVSVLHMNGFDSQSTKAKPVSKLSK